jgi:exopolysaccharide biosynthesis polyprenyl glycosylphosphotransferase
MLALLVLLRAIARVVAAHLVPPERVVIIGANMGDHVAEKISRHKEYRLSPAFLVDSSHSLASPTATNVDIDTCSFDDLPAILEQQPIDRAIIAFADEPIDELVELVRLLKRHDIKVDVVPRLFEVLGENVVAYSVEGLPLLSLHTGAPTRVERGVKRALDVVISAALLVFVAPLLALLAILVLLDSGRPVLFRQVRLGKDMEQFPMYKFRTMHVDTDPAEHERSIEQSVAGKAVGTNTLQKLDQSKRFTRIGGFLRKTSLDELPQLFNVLRGDMSLVGPRPCLPYEEKFMRPHHFSRFTVPAGITGLWQVRARALSSFTEELDMDVIYVESWSLMLDAKLLLRTPIALVRGSTA